MNHDHFRDEIIKQGWYQQGEFVLSSGKTSNYYIDLRPCIMSPRFIYLPITELLKVLRYDLSHDDALCGVMASGLPLVGALIYRLSTSDRDIASCFCRTQARTHGTMSQVEGPVVPGKHKITLIDDVATSGRSLAETAHILSDAGFEVKRAIVLVDRQEGASDAMDKLGITFQALLTVDDIRKAR